MATGIICQSCGIEAPTRHVSFHQNIGMLVMRTHRKVIGNLCKNCVHKHFYKMTGTTLLLGPWGTISLIIAPCFIIGNLASYLGAIGMPAVPPDATVPLLTEKAIAQLEPHAQTIMDRLNTGETLVAVANDIAPRAAVTPGQVVKYVVALAQQNRPQPPTYGFPVQPVQPKAVIPLQPLDEQIMDAQMIDESVT